MTEETQSLLLKGALLLGAGYAVYVLVIEPAGGVENAISNAASSTEDYLGLTTPAVITAALNTQGTPFDPKFYASSAGGPTILTSAAAQAFATTIYNSMGLFGDGDSAIIAVFRQLQTKSQVSFLAATFEQMYNGDLLTWLQSGTNVFWWNGMTNTDLVTVINLVNALPNT